MEWSVKRRRIKKGAHPIHLPSKENKKKKISWTSERDLDEKLSAGIPPTSSFVIITASGRKRGASRWLSMRKKLTQNQKTIFGWLEARSAGAFHGKKGHLKVLPGWMSAAPEKAHVELLSSYNDDYNVCPFFSSSSQGRHAKKKINVKQQKLMKMR